MAIPAFSWTTFVNYPDAAIDGQLDHRARAHQHVADIKVRDNPQPSEACLQFKPELSSRACSTPAHAP
jgi:hypothetical protein